MEEFGGSCPDTPSLLFPMRRPAFTTLELIVVIAVFAITAATTLPFLGRFQQRATLQSTTEDVVQALRTAQQRAMAGERDESFGVEFLQGEYVEYIGLDYAHRSRAFDRRHVVLRSLHFVGDRDINFTRLTAMSRFGARVLRIDEQGADATTIDVTPMGAVFFRKS